MKSFIITLLIYFCFCGELTHLKKYNYSSFSSEGISGITSLNIEDIDLNDDIHILFLVREGTMDKTIYYGFSNQDSKNTSSISLSYEILHIMNIFVLMIIIVDINIIMILKKLRMQNIL